MGKIPFGKMILASLAVVGGLLVLEGCGKRSDVDGTYRDPTGMMTLVFHGDTVDITAGPTLRESFELAGDKVTVKTSDGRVHWVLTRNADGSLSMPDGKALRKVGT